MCISLVVGEELKKNQAVVAKTMTKARSFFASRKKGDLAVKMDASGVACEETRARVVHTFAIHAQLSVLHGPVTAVVGSLA